MISKNYVGRAPNYHLWDEARFCLDTMHMHWLARALYRTLLQTAWQLSTRPDLPDDDEQLCNIACGGDHEVWAKHGPAVRTMLTPDTVNGLSVLSQGRLRRDFRYLEEKRQALQNAGRKGGKKRQARLKAGSGYPEAKPEQGFSQPQAREVKEVKRSEGSKEKRKRKRESSGPQTSPSPDSTSSGSSGQDKAKPALDYLMEKAKALSEGKAGFTKKSKADLREALKELGTISTDEIAYAIKAKLETCTDQTAFAIFGSTLAADLVSTVRNRRRQKAAADSERIADQWHTEFREQCNNPEIDGWIAAHPVPAQFAASLPRWLEDVKTHQADNHLRAEEEAEPSPTAEEMFGGPIAAAG